MKNVNSNYLFTIEKVIIVVLLKWIYYYDQIDLQNKNIVNKYHV